MVESLEHIEGLKNFTWCQSSWQLLDGLLISDLKIPTEGSAWWSCFQELLANFMATGYATLHHLGIGKEDTYATYHNPISWH